MQKISSFGIVVNREDEQALNAAKLLRDELCRRTGLPFELADCGDISLRIDKKAAPAPEGFVLKVAGGKVSITGYDKLGAIYGAGRFLKECRWAKGSLEAGDMEISSYPKKPMRGVHLGYGRSNNAYNLWDKEIYGQYIKELALFGANSIEFSFSGKKSREDDPDRKCSPFEMMRHITGLTHELGMKVWVKISNPARNDTGIDIPRGGFVPETSEAARQLNEMLRTEDARREESLSQLEYIDHIFIPGGDPGHLEAGDLFAYSERVANITHKYHPNAGVWLSPQIVTSGEKFTREFYEQVTRRPKWLTGVCHSPWSSHTMEKCRELTPTDMPIRSFPDICHMLCCQYPVHEMDAVWAVTAGRECYNPRPRWHKRMHNLIASYNVGNLPYSEGIADDVSKFIWLDQDWSCDIPAQKTLRDIASMFVSPDRADDIASLLAGFEDILVGPAVSNGAARHVYAGLKAVEEELSKQESMPGYGAESYRLKMPRLMSAFYHYIQQKAVRDSAVMQKALCEIDAGGAAEEIADRIQEDLAEVDTSPNPELLSEIWRLADECFEGICWKVSTTRHKSPNYSRGGFLDTLSSPLCNSNWLKASLEKLSLIDDEVEKQRALQALRDRRCAGPGGVYISLGEPAAKRFLRMEKNWWDEPEAITIPRIEQHVDIWNPHLKDENPDAPFDKILLERVSSALGYYGSNVVLDIDGLVPGAEYELRIVFPLRFKWLGESDIPAFVSVCGQKLKYIGNVPGDEWVYIYEIPAGLVDKEGKLTLTIDKEEGPRGSGASELWLVKVNG